MLEWFKKNFKWGSKLQTFMKRPNVFEGFKYFRRSYILRKCLSHNLIFNTMRSSGSIVNVTIGTLIDCCMHFFHY